MQINNFKFQLTLQIIKKNLKKKNYLVQIKNNEGFVVSLGWISGQLTPDQKLCPSLSWTPNESGEFTTEIYVWEGLINHRALSQYTTLQINVS